MEKFSYNDFRTIVKTDRNICMPASTKSPVITIMSGLLSDSNSSSFLFPFPNSALCKSDTCAIRNPENAVGIRLLEIFMLFIVNAVLPHIVQMGRTKNIAIIAHNFIHTFEIGCFFMFPHPLLELLLDDVFFFTAIQQIVL